MYCIKWIVWTLVAQFLISIEVNGQNEPTYHGAVKHIIRHHCSPCHLPGGDAPFPLTTYESLKKLGPMLPFVVLKGFMPPWKANPAFRHFEGERVMDSIEIRALSQWVKNGMPKGKRTSADPKQNRLAIPAPDLILKMPVPVLLKGDGKELFLCYKIPYEIKDARPVAAITFKPGKGRVVHHASYQVYEVPTESSYKQGPYFFEYNDSINNVDDERDLSLLGMQTEGKKARLVFHTGWLPGTSIQQFPKNVGFIMPSRGVVLIRNLHYRALPIAQKDQSEIHIWFAKDTIHRKLEFAAFKPRNTRKIIPKDTVMNFSLTLRIGSDMTFLAINPHMHKIGTYFKVWAVLPQGDSIPLVEIPKWDFNWQDFYRFKTPIFIPKGSYINAIATYDNTKNNIFNPNNPLKDVYFEKGNMDDDSEEMMRLVFMYLPYHAGDEKMSIAPAWLPTKLPIWKIPYHTY